MPSLATGTDIMVTGDFCTTAEPTKYRLRRFTTVEAVCFRKQTKRSWKEHWKILQSWNYESLKDLFRVSKKTARKSNISSSFPPWKIRTATKPWSESFPESIWTKFMVWLKRPRSYRSCKGISTEPCSVREKKESWIFLSKNFANGNAFGSRVVDS